MIKNDTNLFRLSEKEMIIRTIEKIEKTRLKKIVKTRLKSSQSYQSLQSHSIYINLKNIKNGGTVN